MADGKVVIDVLLDDGTVAKGVANIDKKLGGVANAGRRAASGIKEIVTALGLVQLASKAIDMVSRSLDGAISRYDTLNNFPRVLQQIGFDADTSQKAIQRLSDGVQGLPTTLDSVASTAQRIAVMTGDLDGAVETTLALNNAFISSGSSQQDAARGLEQYVQMLAKGEVDLQSWRTLQETMGVALNDVAKAFGFAGASAQNDLYEALKNGHITFDEFNAKIIELSNATGGFAERALTASGGIRTAWTNMRTAVVRGVTNIIGAIDSVLADTSLGSLENIISNIGKAFFTVLDTIAQQIPNVVNLLSSVKEAIDPWLPAIQEFIEGMVSLFQERLQAIWQIVQEIWGNVRSFWEENGQVILSNATTVFESVWSTVQKAFDAIQSIIRDVLGSKVIPFVREQLQSLQKFWEENGQQIMQAVQNAFNFIKSVVEAVMPAVKFIIEIVWSAIQDIISGALNVIQGLIQVFTGIFTGDWKQLWEGIKSILKGAVDLILGIMTLQFLGGIRTAFTNLLKSGTEIIKNMWTAIVNFFKGFSDDVVKIVSNFLRNLEISIKIVFNSIRSTTTNIWTAIRQTISEIVRIIFDVIKDNFNKAFNFIKTIFTNVWNFISSIWETIFSVFKNALGMIKNLVTGDFTGMKNNIINILNIIKNFFTTIWNQIIDFLRGIDLFQVGKDIMMGLVNGIGSMASAVVDKVKNIGSNLINGFKSVLGIHSPSRVMKGLGEDTVQGLTDGIEGKQKTVDKTMEEMAKSIVKITDSMNKEIESLTEKSNAEIKKVEKRAQEDINLIHSKAKKAKRGLTESEAVRIRRIEEDAAKKIKDLETKTAADIQKIRENHLKEIEKINREQFELSKNWIERQKELNNLSLMEELAAWERVQARYIKGSKEREEAEKNIYRVKQEIYEQLNSLNEEYFNKVQEINRRLIEEEQRLNAEYNKAVEDRAKALASFVSIFDEIDRESNVTGQQLVDNLRGQVEVFAEWAQNIKELAERGIDQGLLEELRQMGPKAYAEIAALNTLTDEELTEYSALWKTKNELARKQAVQELEVLRQETQIKIDELHKQAANQLTTLQQEWQQKVQQIRTGTKDEFSVMKSDLRTIGEQSIKGMIDGLSSMEGALFAKARSIADAVKATISSALNIHSPSRWMRDFIGKNMVLGWIEGIDRQQGNIVRKAEQMTDWMKPDISNGIVNPLRGVGVPLGNIFPDNVSTVSNSHSSIKNDHSKHVNVQVQGGSDAREIARQVEKAQRRLIFQMG